MAILINEVVVIDDNRRGAFSQTNLGNFDQINLDNLSIKGEAVGDMVFNTDLQALNFWDGEKWVPQSRSGEAIYKTPGTFTWVCPPGVSKVHVACVGGGGAGGFKEGHIGGCGGGLGWKNDISVIPGQGYTVVVGRGGSPYTSSGNGGNSYFISSSTVKGGGGLGGPNRNKSDDYETTYISGGSFVGDGGGQGGGFNSYWTFAHGGAGAAGYVGRGGSFNYNSRGDNGAGGGGGAGTGGDAGTPIDWAVCISVIDEVSPSANTISQDWNDFRRNHPNRTFWLLQPEGRHSASALKIPPAYKNDPKTFGPVTVRRDNGNVYRTSDWFDICGLKSVTAGTSISLAIDNSGSTKVEEVQASINLFRSKCNQAGLQVYEVIISPNERWAVPHNKPLPEKQLGGAGESKGNGGGGTGLYGQGTNGQGGAKPGVGGYGRGGSPAHGTGLDGVSNKSRPDGGFPGGGGGQDHRGNQPGLGGGGAVRIIWGRDRAWPTKNVGLTEGYDTNGNKT